MKRYRVVLYFLIYVTLIYGGLAYFSKSPTARRVMRHWLSHKASEQGIELSMGDLEIALFDVGVRLQDVTLRIPKHGVDFKVADAVIILRPIYLLSGIFGFDRVRFSNGTLSVIEVETKGENSVNTKGLGLENLRFHALSLENINFNIQHSTLSGNCMLKSATLGRFANDHLQASARLVDCPLIRKDALPIEKSFPIKEILLSAEMRGEDVKIKSLSIDAQPFALQAAGELNPKSEWDLNAQLILKDQPELLEIHQGVFLKQGRVDAHVEGSFKNPKITLDFDLGQGSMKKIPFDNIKGEITRLPGNDLEAKKLSLSLGKSTILLEKAELKDKKLLATLSAPSANISQLQHTLMEKPNPELSGELKLGAEIQGVFGDQWNVQSLSASGSLEIGDFKVVAVPQFEVLRVAKISLPFKCFYERKTLKCPEMPLDANTVPIKISVVGESAQTVIQFQSSQFKPGKITPHIAVFDVQGQGKVSGKITINPDQKNKLRVDGFAELANASMDTFRFNDLRMNVTYDWDGDILGFRSGTIRGSPGSLAEANLEVVIQKNPILRGKAVIQKASGRDLSDWGLNLLPDALQFSEGEWGGELQFNGKTELGQFEASARMRGRQTQWLGQNFDDVTVEAKGDQKGFRIARMDLSRQSWSGSGSLSVDNDQKLKGSLQASQVPLSDVQLQHFFPWSRSVQWGGTTSINVDLDGSVDASRVRVALSGKQVSLNALPAGDLSFRYDFQPQKKSLIQIEAAGKNSLQIENEGSAFRFSQQLSRYNLYPLIQLILPLKPDKRNQLFVTSSGKMEGIAQPWKFTSLAQSVDEMKFVSSSSDLTIERFSFDSRNGQVPIKLRLRGQHGNASVDGELDSGGSGNVHVKGAVDMGWMADWIEAVDWSQGEMAIDSRLLFTHWIPKTFRGNGTVNGATLEFSFLEERLEDINANLEFRDDGVAIENGDAQLGDGSVKLKGLLGYPWVENSKMELNVGFNDVKLKPYPELFLALAGDITLSGRGKPLLLKGDLKILRADLVGDKLSEEIASKTIESRFLPSQFQKGTREWFNMNLAVSIPSRVRIESRQFTGEMKGDFRVLGTDVKPIILGNILVLNGSLAIRENDFLIDSGSLRFENQGRIDPQLNISSHIDLLTEDRNYRVYLNILGTWSFPRLEYSSDPPLSKEDITSLVVFGVTTQKFEVKEGPGVLQQELVPQLFARTGLSRNLEKSTGLKVRLDSNYANTRDGSLPRLSVSRRVGKDVEVKFISNIDSDVHREFNVQYQFNKNVSVKGLWEGRSASTAETNNQIDETKNSFGGDVQFKVEFE